MFCFYQACYANLSDPLSKFDNSLDVIQRTCSCSANGSACLVTTCISCMPRTVGYSLAKSIKHLDLTVMTLLTLFGLRHRWILGLPRTLLCSLDLRRPIKTTKTRKSNKRGHMLQMRIRRKTTSYPHRKKFYWPCECRWTVVVQPICQHSPLSCWAALLLFVAIACSGYRLSKITLMMSPYLSPIAEGSLK